MKLQYMSDLHLEFSQHPADNPQPEVLGDVLVLPGDVTIKNRVDWIVEQAARFKHIVYVYGNHEFYRSNMSSVKKHTVRKLPENVHVLDNQSVTLDGVTFHGGTLWTSMRDGDPFVMMEAEGTMNDFRVIRDEKYQRFTPQKARTEHLITRLYLEENVRPGDVVVTHHAPCELSIHEQYKGSNLNHAYYTDLTDLMFDLKPSVWLHGHVHSSFDYTIGDTRVLCNPRGYVGYELNREFDLNAIVEI